MSQRCGFSKPTPTPLNGKATKPAKYVKKMKGRPINSLKRQEEIVKRKPSPCHPRRRGGARKMHGQEKREYQRREEKQHGRCAQNHRTPAYNSENVSCATNEWPDHPHQPRGFGCRTYIVSTPPSRCQNKAHLLRSAGGTLCIPGQVCLISRYSSVLVGTPTESNILVP